MKPDQPVNPTSSPGGAPGASSPPFATSPDSSSSSTRAQIEQKAHAVKDTLKEKTAAAADDLKARGEGFVTDQKDHAADRIDRYGQKFDAAAENFEDEDPNIAWVTHQAAERLNRLAEHVRDRDFRSLWQDAEGMARRHPVAFVGGMFAAGVALGSVVRAARSDAHAHDDDADLDYSANHGYADEDPLAYEEELLATPGVTRTNF